MPGRARKLTITERQQVILRTMIRSGTCPQSLAQRARMILLAFDGRRNEDIAARVGCERHAVGPWRHRWADIFDRLVLLECCEKQSALARGSGAVLNDLPRDGSAAELADEVVKRGESISPRQVGRFFKNRPKARRIAAASGSMPSPMIPRSSPGRSRPSAPATWTLPAS